MSLDKRLLYEAALERKLAIANGMAKAGDRQGTATALSETAELYRRLSQLEKDPRLQARRIHLASKLEQRANRVKETVGGDSPSPRVEEGGELQVEEMIHESSVSWDDICGLEDTKREIKMAYGLTLGA